MGRWTPALGRWLPSWRILARWLPAPGHDGKMAASPGKMAAAMGNAGKMATGPRASWEDGSPCGMLESVAGGGQRPSWRAEGGWQPSWEAPRDVGRTVSILGGTWAGRRPSWEARAWQGGAAAMPGAPVHAGKAWVGILTAACRPRRRRAPCRKRTAPGAARPTASSSPSTRGNWPRLRPRTTCHAPASATRRATLGLTVGGGGAVSGRLCPPEGETPPPGP